MEVIGLSLQVSVSAVTIASLIGLPLAALLAVTQASWPKTLTVTVFNALMGLPPVVVGLLVYLLLSRAGPLGSWGLLFTPTAMVIAQTILVLPLIIALAHQKLALFFEEYTPLFASLQLSRARQMRCLLFEARFALTTTVLAGFGRAIAEVGAVMMVGGNINHVTRVMTTTIALETSKGELELATALGLLLIVITLLINAALEAVRMLAIARGAQ